MRVFSELINILWAGREALEGQMWPLGRKLMITDLKLEFFFFFSPFQFKIRTFRESLLVIVVIVIICLPSQQFLSTCKCIALIALVLLIRCFSFVFNACVSFLFAYSFSTTSAQSEALLQPDENAADGLKGLL